MGEEAPAEDKTLLPWEDYKELATKLKVRGSVTDILKDDMLELSTDEANFLVFTRGRDSDLYDFNFDKKVPVIMRLMEIDENLSNMFSNLVPSRTSE